MKRRQDRRSREKRWKDTELLVGIGACFLLLANSIKSTKLEPEKDRGSVLGTIIFQLSEKQISQISCLLHTVADRLSEKSKDGVLFKRPGCKYTRFGLKRPHSTRQRVGRHVLVTCLTNTSNLASLKPSSPTNLFTLQIRIQKSPKTGLRRMSY